MSQNRIQIGLDFMANTQGAKSNLLDLANTLHQISVNSHINVDPSGITSATNAARELAYHLSTAINVDTGKLNMSKFNTSLKASGQSLGTLSSQLLTMGADGQKAFLQLSNAVAQAELPILTLGSRLSGLMTTFKNTVKWMISSSILTSGLSMISNAYNYAKDLDGALNDIQIVSKLNTEEMARFAIQANKAAQALSNTTVKYAEAALIYYQQGLSGDEVEKRTQATIKMANVTGQSAATVSDQLTAIWNNFAEGASNLEYYADVVTALGAATASSTDEIATGLEKFAAVGEAIGLSYEYATSAVATIVDQTRLSSEIVGTALKTIFARMEGLKLGETLEDGVTLNQYSEGLQKIGVDILDASGNLKEMNEILDDAGQRWQELSRAEQVATAQTVSGIRQYTTFMALMENYDKFKAKVSIAEESEGELQAQQEIYEQSWEASINRVKAAGENIFNTLIDKDIFIGVNDFVSEFLTRLDDVTDKMGGIKTIIIGVLSLVTSMLSTKIAPLLQSATNSFMLLTGQANSVYSKNSEELNKSTQQALSLGYYSDAEKAQLENNVGMTDAKSRLAMQKNLSSQERTHYEMQLTAIQSIGDERVKQLSIVEKEVAKEKELTAQLETQKAAVTTLANSSGDSLLKSNISKGNQYNYSENVADLDNAIYRTSEYVANYHAATQTAVEGSMEMTAATKGVVDGYNSVTGSLTKVSAEQDKYNSTSQNAQATLKTTKSLYASIASDLARLTGGNETATTAVKKLQTAAKNSETTFEQLQGAMNTVISAFSKLKITGTDAETIMKRSFSSGFMQEYNGAVKAATSSANALTSSQEKQKNAADAAKAAQDNYNAAIKNFKPQHIVQTSEALMGLSSTLMQFGMGLSYLNTAKETLNDPNLTGMEKFTQLLITISMLSMTGFGMIRGVSQIANFSKQIIAMNGLLGMSIAEIAGAAAAQEVFNYTTKQGVEQLKEDVAAKTLNAALTAIMTGATKEQAKAKIVEALSRDKNLKNLEEESMEQLTNTIYLRANSEATRRNSAQILKNKLIRGLYIAAIVAAVVALTLITVAIVKETDAMGKANKKVEEQGQRLAEAKKSAEDAQKAYEDLIQSLKDLDSVQDSFKTLVKGTDEFNDALDKNNEKVMDLIEQYQMIPDLLDEVTTDNETGLMTISKKGEELIKAAERENKNAAQFAKIYEQQRYNQAKSEQAAIKYSTGVGDTFNAEEASIVFSATLAATKNPILSAAAAITANTKAYNDNQAIIEDLSKNFIAYGESVLLESSTAFSKLDSVTQEYIKSLDGNTAELRSTLIELRKLNDYEEKNLEGQADVVNKGNVLYDNSSVQDILARYAADNFTSKNLEGFDRVVYGIFEHYGLFDDKAKEEEIQKYLENRFGNDASNYRVGNRNIFTGKRKIQKSQTDDNGQTTNKYETIDYVSLLDMVEYNNRIAGLTLDNDVISKINSYYSQTLKDLSELDNNLLTDEMQKGLAKSLTGFYAGVNENLDFGLQNLNFQELKQVSDNLQKLKVSDITNVKGDELTGDDIKRQLEEQIQQRQNAIRDAIKDANLKVIETLEAEEAKTLQSIFADAEIDQGVFNDYVKKIEEVYGYSTERAKEMAMTTLENGIAIKKLKDPLEEIKGVIKSLGKEGAKTDLLYTKSIREINNIFKDWLNVTIEEEDKIIDLGDSGEKTILGLSSLIDKGILSNALSDDAKVAEEALSKIRENAYLAAVDALNVATLTEEAWKELENNESLASAFENFTFDGVNAEIENFKQKLYNLPNEIGSPGGEIAEEFLKDMNKMVTIGAVSMADLQKIMSNMGYDLKIEEVEGEPITNSQVIRTYDYSGGKKGDLTSEVIVETTSDVKVPQIVGADYVPNNIRSNLSGNKNKSSGGGKSGKSKKDPYYENTRSKAAAQSQLDDIRNKKDRAVGVEKLKYLRQEEDALRSLITLEKERKSIAEDEYKTNRAYLESLGVKFNEFGEITQESHNNLIDLMNSTTDSEKQEQIKEAISTLETASDTIKDCDNSIKEFKETIEETNFLEDIQIRVEAKLEVSDLKRQWLEWQKDHQNDFSFNVGARMVTDQALISTYTNDAESNRNAALDIIKKHGYTSVEDYVEDLKDGTQKLSKNEYDEFKEYFKKSLEDDEKAYQGWQDYFNNISQYFEHYNKGFSKLSKSVDHIVKITDSYNNIIDLIGQDRLGITNQQRSEIEDIGIKASSDAVEYSRQKYKHFKKISDGLQAQYDAANDDEKAALQEQLDMALENTRTAEEEMLSTLSTVLEEAGRVFENRVERAMNNLAKQMFNGMSLDEFNEALERQEEKDQRYIADYKQIYELSKMTRQIEKSIDNSSNIKAKEKLRDLEQEINDYVAQRGQLSEYDLGYLQKKYDLRVAEIALEEAQNAKSAVRLTRDSEGNYGYTYTADNSKTAEAEQSYEDKLYALQEYNSNAANEMSKNQAQVVQSYIEYVSSLDATDENYKQKLAEANAYFSEQMQYYGGQLDTALMNNQLLYANDWMKYSEATGYKIRDNGLFITNLNETITGKALGIDGLLASGEGFYQRFQTAIGIGNKESGSGVLGQLITDHDIWKKTVSRACSNAGISVDNFATTIKKRLITDEDSALNELKEVKNAFIELQETEDEAVQKMLDDLDKQLPHYETWMKGYTLRTRSLTEEWANVLAAYNAYAAATGGQQGAKAKLSNTAQSAISANASAEAAAAKANVEIEQTEPEVKPQTSFKPSIWYEYTYDHPIRGSITTTSKQQVLNDLWNLYGKKVDAYESSSNGSQKIVPKYKYKLRDGKWSNYFETLEEVQDKLLKTYSIQVRKYDTGGYTGEWGPDGRLAMLHQKELVLNANDTKNFLSAVDILRDITKAINLQAVAAAGNLGSPVAASISPTDQVIEQHVEITAEFPNATNHNEIEEAFRNLANVATQYTMRNQR